MRVLEKDNNVSRINIIFILLFMIVSADTVMFGTNGSPIYLSIRKIFSLFLIPLVYFVCFFNHEKKTDNQLILIASVMSALVIMSAIINGEIGPQTLTRISLIISGFIYVSMTPLKKFMIAYEKAMYFLVIIALLVYIIVPLVPQLLSLSSHLKNVNGYIYYNYYFAVVTDNFFRLQGPFREAGVCGLFFSYALLFYFCYVDKLDYKRVALYVAAIILTSSTTSIFVLPFIVLFYVMNRKGTKSSKSTYGMIILFSIAAIALFLYTDLFAEDGLVLGKLNDEDNSSRLARLSSVFTSFEIIRSNPFFGVGVTEAGRQFSLFNYHEYGKLVVDNTNLYLSYAAVYGVPYALIATVGIYYFCKCQSRFFLARLMFIIPAMLLFFGETMFENLFVFIIIGYGYKMVRADRNISLSNKNI